MADHTDIEWADATWNPITGCSIVSPACTNCYAMALAGTRLKNLPSRKGLTKQVNGKHVWTGEVRLNRQWLHQPSQWTRPRKIFVCAHGDLFAENVPDEWIIDVLTVIACNPHHTFQVLTKRAERMFDFMSQSDLLEDIYVNWSGFSGAPREVQSWPLQNLWLGVSVEDQRRANERRDMLACLAAEGWTTWVSYEPALGPIDWRGWEFLKWLVSGGESGPDVRPSHPDWHRAARDFCAAYGIPYLFKQWGNWIAALDRDREDPDWRADYSGEFNQARKGIAWLNLAGGTGFHGERFHIMRRVKKSDAGRLLDGVEHNAFPTTPQREEAR
jgi:protein gp37